MAERGRLAMNVIIIITGLIRDNNIYQKVITECISFARISEGKTKLFRVAERNCDYQKDDGITVINENNHTDFDYCVPLQQIQLKSIASFFEQVEILDDVILIRIRTDTVITKNELSNITEAIRNGAEAALLPMRANIHYSHRDWIFALKMCKGFNVTSQNQIYSKLFNKNVMPTGLGLIAFFWENNNIPEKVLQYSVSKTQRSSTYMANSLTNEVAAYSIDLREVDFFSGSKSALRRLLFGRHRLFRNYYIKRLRVLNRIGYSYENSLKQLGLKQ
ncbi:hypothetical protein N9755_01375 [bacterium]|nr:hypothetical protein [bacterium]